MFQIAMRAARAARVNSSSELTLLLLLLALGLAGILLSMYLGITPPDTL